MPWTSFTETDVKTRGRGMPADYSKRDLDIFHACEAGISFSEVATRYGLTGGRVKQIVERQRRHLEIARENVGTPREVLSTRAYNIVAHFLGLGSGWKREQLLAIGLNGLEEHRKMCGKLAMRELEEYVGIAERHTSRRADEMDHCEEFSTALAGIGLEPVGISRDEEFIIATAHIGGDAISQIEEMMGGEMPFELKDLIHLVIERCAHRTGPQAGLDP